MFAINPENYFTEKSNVCHPKHKIKMSFFILSFSLVWIWESIFSQLNNKTMISSNNFQRPNVLWYQATQIVLCPNHRGKFQAVSRLNNKVSHNKFMLWHYLNSWIIIFFTMLKKGLTFCFLVISLHFGSSSFLNFAPNFINFLAGNLNLFSINCFLSFPVVSFEKEIVIYYFKMYLH